MNFMYKKDKFNAYFALIGFIFWGFSWILVLNLKLVGPPAEHFSFHLLTGKSIVDLLLLCDFDAYALIGLNQCHKIK